MNKTLTNEQDACLLIYNEKNNHVALLADQHMPPQQLSLPEKPHSSWELGKHGLEQRKLVASNTHCSFHPQAGFLQERIRFTFHTRGSSLQVPDPLELDKSIL